jgi:RNA polymerase sigma-70 factor, ECF subfamily
LITVLDHLDDFRGESKFTTWAYKFAVNISLAHARREGWKQHSPEMDSAGKTQTNGYTFNNFTVQTDAELRVLQGEVITVLNEAIQHDLSDKQRIVFRLIVYDQYPMDGVVQHLGSNRNAVYKLLHDARIKLKRALQAHGFAHDEILQLFGTARENR